MKQLAVYIADCVAKKVNKYFKCHVCNNKIISNDNDVENDKHLKTLSRGDLSYDVLHLKILFVRYLAYWKLFHR